MCSVNFKVLTRYIGVGLVCTSLGAGGGVLLGNELYKHRTNVLNTMGENMAQDVIKDYGITPPKSGSVRYFPAKMACDRFVHENIGTIIGNMSVNERVLIENSLTSDEIRTMGNNCARAIQASFKNIRQNLPKIAKV